MVSVYGRRDGVTIFRSLVDDDPIVATVLDAKGTDVDLSTYKGKALLIVNVASQWIWSVTFLTGFKPNVDALEMLLGAYFAQIEGTLNKLSTHPQGVVGGGAGDGAGPMVVFSDKELEFHEKRMIMNDARKSKRTLSESLHTLQMMSATMNKL
ncbi:hypothetical protein Scep_009267 [Stephania cephalantha]|uniref:Uncharacterized protein n=1 Tax=Stephania cephalantha TaxID=152367 RepID=A0AAP0PG44_9MAGN